VYFFVFTGNRPAWIVFCARCEDGQIRKNSKGLLDLVVKIVKLPKSRHANDIFTFDDIDNLYAKIERYFYAVSFVYIGTAKNLSLCYSILNKFHFLEALL